jgi:hypothetical protein
MTQVTFASVRGSSVTVDSGDVSPVLMDGTVTWDTVARPKRTALTRFTGRNPWKQDIAIMFDGVVGGVSQEGKISKLMKMSTEPSIVHVSGHALETNTDWVFNGIDWDDQNTIWEKNDSGRYRIRQTAVVHLLEYIPDTIIQTPAAPKPNKNKPTKHVPAAHGMSLKKIAMVEYGDPDKWKLIRDANAILIGAGPRYVVPAGITLVIPEDDGTQVLFTVP